MKLRNSLAILAFAGAFLLAGCSNPTPAPAESSQPAATSQPAESSRPTGLSTPAATSQPAATSSAAQQTSSEAAQKVTVTFDVGEGSPIAPVQVDKGSTVERPADPTREGYDFAGWYADEYCVTPYNFDTKVSADTTIYADWTPVAQQSSEEESIPGPEGNVIYFRDDYWWNHLDGKVAAKFDDLDPVIAQDNVWIPVEAEDIGVNVWTINVPDGAQTVTFIRSYATDTEFAGPRTPTLTLSERTADVYDVYKEVKDWPSDESAPIVGNWISYGEAIAIEPWVPSGDDSGASSQDVPTGQGFSFVDVDSGATLVELEDQGEVDVYGTKYHQYHAAALSVTAGQKIALHDASTGASWAAAIDSYSFGCQGSAEAVAAWLTIGGEGAYYEVQQDFTAEVYAKFLFGKDNVYFGLAA